MSFSMTTPQVRAGIKDVTRRLGWWFLKPGDIVNAVEKCRGLKKGEKVKLIRQIKIVSTETQRLYWIDAVDLIREGFPRMTPFDFVVMFMKANRCRFDKEINRIEFNYVEETE
jgi:hypothetical protein